MSMRKIISYYENNDIRFHRANYIKNQSLSLYTALHNDLPFYVHMTNWR